MKAGEGRLMVRLSARFLCTKGDEFDKTSLNELPHKISTTESLFALEGVVYLTFERVVSLYITFHGVVSRIVYDDSAKL